MGGSARLRSLLVLLACVGWLACESTAPPASHLLPEPAAGVPDRTLVVSVGGLDADALATDMPFTASLADAGALAEHVHSAAPAAAYPAHATLVTGVATGVHGVVADHLLGDHGVRIARYAHASHLKVATLWQLAQESGMAVASLDWPSTLGAEIPQLLPDVQAPRHGVSWAESVRPDTTPALQALVLAHGGDTVESGRPSAGRDTALVSIACDLLASGTPPRLLLLRLAQTEPVLEFHGPGSAQAATAFRNVDREIERLVDCVAQTSPLARAALVVTGDHGVAPVHTDIAPNAVLARDRLLEVSGDRIDHWTAIARSNGGSAFVYAKGEASALRAREALERAARETGAFRIVSAEELMRADADAEAWFGLEAEPGYRFLNSPNSRVVAPSAARGAAGYLSEDAGMDGVFAAWGCGIRPRIRIPAMEQIDVAPTLARLLGLSLDSASGRALVGVLAGGGPPPVASGARGASPDVAR